MPFISKDIYIKRQECFFIHHTTTNAFTPLAINTYSSNGYVQDKINYSDPNKYYTCKMKHCSHINNHDKK